MAAKEHMPPPPPLQPAPEYVGPPRRDGTREDVSRYTERQLLLRALDESLQVKAKLEAVIAQSNLHGARLDLVEDSLAKHADRLEAHEKHHASLESHAHPKSGTQVDVGLDEDGDPLESSYNQIVGQFKQAGETLYRRSKDPHDPLTPDGVKAIAQQVQADARKEDKVMAYDAWTTALRRAKWSIVIAVATAAAIGACGIAWGVVQREAGVSEEKQRQHSEPAPAASR